MKRATLPLFLLLLLLLSKGATLSMEMKMGTDFEIYFTYSREYAIV